MQQDIIGRELEQDILLRLLNSKSSEFVAIYGRRRIGKSFLVNELFGKKITVRVTGLFNKSKVEQIRNFNEALAEAGLKGRQQATDWREVFSNLNALLQGLSHEGKKIVFLDEMPWMDTPRSGFLSALEHYWNHWASHQNDVLLIVCGSATSWMVKNLVNNYGGLHNRLTRQIMLEPFTLRECEAYLKSRSIAYTRKQVVESYMAFGGVPYYMSLMSPESSLYQNIDDLYFAPTAPLRNEYTNLYHSLFRKQDGHLTIINALAKKGKGLTRQAIIKATRLSDGGGLSRTLDDLVNNGFIRFYQSFSRKQKEGLYQIIDPFTLFHLHFNEQRKVFSENYWMQFTLTPSFGNWAGYAFERVCLLHVPQIKKALGISGVLTQVYSWKSRSSVPGAQIDLVIDRHDGIASLCEAKYAQREFTIDRAYSEKLRIKREAFSAETETNRIPQTVMISASGITRNQYKEELTAQITLDDLFA